MNILMNEVELKQVYTYDKDATAPLDYARNLAYKLGASTWNDNKFDRELDRLVKRGILKQVYDFVENGCREGLYEFWNGKAQISFFGTNHMDMRLFYSY